MTLPVPMNSKDERPERERWLDWAKCSMWTFTGYYKYTFTFTATGYMYDIDRIGEIAELFTATVEAGGDSGAIYRYDVKAEPMTWSDIIACGWYEQESGADPYLVVRKADRTLLFSTDEHLKV